MRREQRLDEMRYKMRRDKMRREQRLDEMRYKMRREEIRLIAILSKRK